MPNLDKTGPQGRGPKTGQAFGDCDDNSQKRTDGFFQRCFKGRGFGRKGAFYNNRGQRSD